MTTEDAFLQDILENPDDDTPRLVFADWLDDQGDEDRGEFIRLQCRLAGLPCDQNESRAIRDRIELLLSRHWDEWVRPLAKLTGPIEGWLMGGYHPEALWKFRRGFVYMLDLDTRKFLSNAPEIFRLAPLRRLRLRGAGPLAQELASCPLLRWVEGLDFIDYWTGPLDADSMRHLAHSPYLDRLSWLGLYRNDLADDGAEHLAIAPWLSRVVILELGENGLTSRGIAALSRTARPFRPLRLRLGANPIGDSGARELAASPIVSRLTSLALDGCGIAGPGLEALAQSPHLSSLRFLDLDGNRFGDDGARRLAVAPWLRHLSALYVRGCGLGDGGVYALDRLQPGAHPRI